MSLTTQDCLLLLPTSSYPSSCMPVDFRVQGPVEHFVRFSHWSVLVPLYEALHWNRNSCGRSRFVFPMEVIVLPGTYTMASM